MKGKSNCSECKVWGVVSGGERLWYGQHEVGGIGMTSERTRFVSCCLSPATSWPAVNNLLAQLCWKVVGEEQTCT